MNLGLKLLSAAACLVVLNLTCGFATSPSQSIAADVIVTAAPAYYPLAALQGAVRFPHGAV